MNNSALTVCAAVAALSFAAPATAQDDPRARLLVDAAWLDARLGDDDLVVLHIGRGYDDGHIPGAVDFDLGGITYSTGERGDADHVMLDLPPDLETVRAAFEAAGVSDGSTVVLAFEGRGMAQATRTLWTLDVVGLGEAGRLLDGGLDGWVASGRELSTEAARPQPGRITATPRLDRRAEQAFVLAQGNAPGIALVDARRPGHYAGDDEETDGRAGHIPGAGSLFFGDLFTDDARLKPASELRDLFEAAGFEEGDRVVAYCHIGLWASGVVFAARTLGLDAVLYDGSMREWAWDRSLPLESSSGGR